MSNLPKLASEQLRTGYTTGSCAAAASQAAVVKLIRNIEMREVRIKLPDEGFITLPIKQIYAQDGKATAEVVKDAGDDPDVTNGISILATVELLSQGIIVIEGGIGVGRVSKPGLAVAVGEAAINPVPRAMICSAVQEVLPPGTGAKIIISVPVGEEVARRTMNSRLGIVGGISILGTSGIVRPMSDAAYFDSLVPQIDQAIALGYRELVFTPGKMGDRRARSMGIAADSIIQTSNFIGTMLQEAVVRGAESILLMGHIGKIIKVAAGIFNTHSRIADARRETLAAHAAMLGAPPAVIKEIMAINTMEAAVELLKKHQLQAAYYSIAASASQRVRELMAGRVEGETVKIGTLLYALDGEILGYDDAGMQLWRKMTGMDVSNEGNKREIVRGQAQTVTIEPCLNEVFAQTTCQERPCHDNALYCDCLGMVKVVGTGPGDSRYITPLALEAIRNGEVIIGARRLLNSFAQPQQVQVIVDRDLRALVACIEEHRHHRRVVVLVSGDTGIFSLADYLNKHMDNGVLEFIPGISSIQLMFARLKRPWQEAQIVSMHGRSGEDLSEQIKSATITAVLTGAPWTPQAIAQFLLEKGALDLQLALGKDLSYPHEKLVFCSLQELSLDKEDYSNTVMVIFNE